MPKLHTEISIVIMYQTQFFFYCDQLGKYMKNINISLTLNINNT